MKNNNFTFFISQFKSGIKYAELVSESSGKLYQYWINANGDIQAGVNCKAVESMPKTSTTKRLTAMLEQVKDNLVKMINISPADTPEYRQLFWTIKETLGQ